MVAPINPTLGFNAFHASANLTGDALTIFLDDMEFKHGCKKLRFNHLPYNLVSSEAQQYIDTKAAILACLARGFHCIFGLTLNVVHTNNVTQANVTVDFKAQQEVVATWAQSIDFTQYPAGAFLELSAGNEEEDNLASNYGGAANLTDAKTLFRTDMRTVVATAMAAIYTKGSINYTTFHSEWPVWITEITTNGWGGLTRFGGNVYRGSAYYMESAKAQTILDLVGALASHDKDAFGKRRVFLGEVQSYDNGLNDTRWVKGNESVAELDIVRRYRLMADRHPDIEFFYFAADVSSSNWDYKVRASGANNLGGYRRWRQFFTSNCTLTPMVSNKMFLQENLIANPFNNPTMDVFGWTAENSATRVVQTTGGFDGGRFMRVTSTTDGNSDIVSNSGSSGGMIIPKHMVGIPILMAFWAKYSSAPTGTGEASVTITTSTGTINVISGSNNFLPTASWQRFYYIFRVYTPNNLNLRLWGKKQFTAQSGVVDYDNLLMMPLFNDNQLEHVLNNHLVEGFYTNSPFTQYEQEPTGSTNVECIRVLPPAATFTL